MQDFRGKIWHFQSNEKSYIYIKIQTIDTSVQYLKLVSSIIQMCALPSGSSLPQLLASVFLTARVLCAWNPVFRCSSDQVRSILRVAQRLYLTETASESQFEGVRLVRRWDVRQRWPLVILASVATILNGPPSLFSIALLYRMQKNKTLPYKYHTHTLFLSTNYSFRGSTVQFNTVLVMDWSTVYWPIL